MVSTSSRLPARTASTEPSPAVADPAVKAEVARFLACPGPIPYTLHTAGDRHPDTPFVPRTIGHGEGCSAYSRSVESTETESPTATWTLAISPARSARSTFSIFMASMTMSHLTRLDRLTFLNRKFDDPPGHR